jgi:putative ABC transport system permease protein
LAHPVTSLHEEYRGDYAQSVYMLLGAVGVVLLIATVNVANLQLNRGVRRQSEMATRMALGAGRWRLFRQLLIENIALALVGGVLGIVVALAGIDVFIFLAPDFYRPSSEIAINGAVLLFALTVCLASGILSGLVPGFRASNPNLSGSLKQGARSVAGRISLGLRRVLVVTEIALAMVLLVSAGLMINSYARLVRVNVGVDPDNVLAFEVNLAGMDRYRTRHGTNHYAVTPEVANFYTRVMERIAALPGVESVASTSNLPPRAGSGMEFTIIGKVSDPADLPETAYHEVSAGYFDTMRIPLLRGRAFTDKDDATAPGVAIISETLARRYFGNEDPIGQSIQVYVNAQNPKLENDRVRQIIGVARDIRMTFRSSSLPIVYVPYGQNPTDYAGFNQFFIHALKAFVVRTSGNPADIAPEVRRAVREADGAVAVTDMMPMRQRLSSMAAGQEFWMRLLGIFAGLGIFLAAIGVYGVISYTVEQRSHEFGIRTAFGARDSDIFGLVLREAVVVTLIGLTIGIAAAFGATRLIANLLFGVTPTDPMTIVAVAVVLSVVALLASYIPARRATKLDPVSVLRAE